MKVEAKRFPELERAIGDLLVEVLEHDSDPDLRIDAARTFHFQLTVTSNSTRAFFAGLNDPDERVRRGMAVLLPIDSGCVPEVLRALKHADPFVRRAVVLGLAYKPVDAAITQELISALSDSDLGVRVLAAETLSLYGSEDNAAEPGLIAALNRVRAEHAANRSALRPALGWVHPSNTTEQARKQCESLISNHESQQLGRTIVIHIKSAKDNYGSLLPLSEKYVPVSIMNAAEMLARSADNLPDRVVVDLLSYMLLSCSSMSGSVASALRTFGKDAVPGLIQALTLGNEYTQRIAGTALSELGRDAAAAVPELVSIVARGGGQPQSDLVGCGHYGQPQCVLLDALARIGPDDERVISCLTEISQDEHDARQHFAESALNSITHALLEEQAKAKAQKRAALLAGLTDSDEKVRRGAAGTISPDVVRDFLTDLGSSPGRVCDVSLHCLEILDSNEMPPALSVGSNAKLEHKYIEPDYILKVFTGLLWSSQPLCTMAVRALAEIGPEAAPSLINACTSRTLAPSVYDDVTCTLAQMGAKDAVPEFLQLVDDGHPCQSSLLVALARIALDDKRVVNCLSSVVAREDDVRQDAVAAALNKIASYKAIGILSGVGVRQPVQEEELLIQRLQSESAEEILVAIDEVEQRLPFGARFFAEPLLAIVERDGASELQDKAARALGQVLPCLPDAIMIWLPLLMDSNSRISRAMSRDDSAQPLFDWFGNLLCSAYAAAGVVYVCARILRNFGTKGVPYLVKGLSSGPLQLLARELGRIGKDATAAVPELLRITNGHRSSPPRQRSAIVDALAQIAPDDERVFARFSQAASNELDEWHYAVVAALDDMALQFEQADTQLAADAADADAEQRATLAMKCVGKYSGKVRAGLGYVDVVTRLSLCETDPTKLCGDYIMHMKYYLGIENYFEYGELAHRSMDGRKLALEWSDGNGVGLLEIVFNDKFTHFEGEYARGLVWYGCRDQ